MAHCVLGKLIKLLQPSNERQIEQAIARQRDESHKASVGSPVEGLQTHAY